MEEEEEGNDQHNNNNNSDSDSNSIRIINLAIFMVVVVGPPYKDIATDIASPSSSIKSALFSSVIKTAAHGLYISTGGERRLVAAAAQWNNNKRNDNDGGYIFEGPACVIGGPKQ